MKDLPHQLAEALDELEKEEKYVDIQVCSHCKSSQVLRVDSMKEDMSVHMELTLPKCECRECDRRERSAVKASSNLTNIKDVGTMAVAVEAEKERQKRRR